MNRLDIIQPGLTLRLRALSHHQQCAVAISACRMAVANAALSEEWTEAAIEELAGLGRLLPATSSKVHAEAALADDAYLDLWNRRDQDPSVEPEAIRLFKRARALAAVGYAGGTDGLSAVCEAIYEAAATADDQLAFVLRAIAQYG